jgi:hypothetical protein
MRLDPWIGDFALYIALACSISDLVIIGCASAHLHAGRNATRSWVWEVSSRALLAFCWSWEIIKVLVCTTSRASSWASLGESSLASEAFSSWIFHSCDLYVLQKKITNMKSTYLDLSTHWICDFLLWIFGVNPFEGIDSWLGNGMLVYLPFSLQILIVSHHFDIVNCELKDPINFQAFFAIFLILEFYCCCSVSCILDMGAVSNLKCGVGVVGFSLPCLKSITSRFPGSAFHVRYPVKSVILVEAVILNRNRAGIISWFY